MLRDYDSLAYSNDSDEIPRQIPGCVVGQVFEI